MQPEKEVIFSEPLIDAVRKELGYIYTGNSSMIFIDVNGLWFFNINVSLAGLTGGIYFDDKGMTPYFGLNFGDPFLSANVTFSAHDVTPGLNAALDSFFKGFDPEVGPGFSFGAELLKTGEYFVETGVGTPGTSVQLFWVMETASWCNILGKGSR